MLVQQGKITDQSPCGIDPCDYPDENPHCAPRDKKYGTDCTTAPRCKDEYCTEPLPFVEPRILLPNKKSSGGVDHEEGAGGKMERFAPASPYQMSMLAYDNEDDVVADNDSDNDVSGKDERGGCIGPIDIDVHIGDTINVNGNQTNDNDTVDVKDNIRDGHDSGGGSGGHDSAASNK